MTRAMTRAIDARHKADEFLEAADNATDRTDWDAETVSAWALCAIGYALIDLTAAIRELTSLTLDYPTTKEADS